MGTSSPYGGPNGGTPLVPSFVDDAPVPQIPAPGEESDPSNIPSQSDSDVSPMQNPAPASPIPVAPPNRFRAPRSNFSRFARSGGSDRKSLGRAISGYVSKSSGGSKTAARKMAPSRASSARIVSFLSSASTRGAREALRSLNLEALAGRPIEDIFLGLADYICPNTGTIDDAIARDAFIETIADLAEEGVTDLDSLTPEQIHLVLEIYASHSIEAKICNDIGTKAVTLPSDPVAAQKVHEQLRDFIRRGVSEALERREGNLQDQNEIFNAVTEVYESAFAILEAMGEREAESE